MPEYDHLDELFARFVAGGPLAVPAGADAARAVVRRRRRARAVAAGALAAVVIAAPVVAFADGGRQEQLRPPPGDNGPTGSASPSASPSASASPSVGASPTVAAPDGRISLGELGNAVLTLPAWPARIKAECPAGTVRFTDGTARSRGVEDARARITKVVHLDADGDGAIETAARLACEGPEWSEQKVIVFDRSADDKIVTMGQVLTNTGDIAFISDIRARGTAIEAKVLDYTGDGVPDDLGQHQWRAYTWDGSRFAQSGGPSSFPPNPKITDLAITGEDLRLEPSGADTLVGTLTLTIGNNGPQRATDPRVIVRMPKQPSATKLPAGCTSIPWQNGVDYLCDLAALGVKASVTLRLTVTASRSAVGTGSIGSYFAEVGWFWQSPDGGGVNYPEPEGKRGNNSIERRIVVGP